MFSMVFQSVVNVNSLRRGIKKERLDGWQVKMTGSEAMVNMKRDETVGLHRSSPVSVVTVDVHRLVHVSSAWVGAQIG